MKDSSHQTPLIYLKLRFCCRYSPSIVKLPPAIFACSGLGIVLPLNVAMFVDSRLVSLSGYSREPVKEGSSPNWILLSGTHFL